MLYLYQEFQKNERAEDQLMMLNFKTTKCDNPMHLAQPLKFAEQCCNYHGNFDRRRGLFDYQGCVRYSEAQCPNIQQYQQQMKACDEGCRFSHNHFEENFHPMKYLINECQNNDHYVSSGDIKETVITQAAIKTCPYFHFPPQRRTIAYLTNQPDQKANLKNLQGMRNSNTLDMHSYFGDTAKSSLRQQNMIQNSSPQTFYQEQPSQQPLSQQEMFLQSQRNNNPKNQFTPYTHVQSNQGMAHIQQQQQFISFQLDVDQQKTIQRRVSHQPNLYHSGQIQPVQYQQVQQMNDYNHQIMDQPYQVMTQQIYPPVNRSMTGFTPQQIQYQHQKDVNMQQYQHQGFVQPAHYSRQGDPIMVPNPNQRKDVHINQNQQLDYLQQIGGEMIQHLNLNKFKTDQCQITHQHNHKHCKFYHSIKDRRRKTSFFLPELCDYSETDRCSKKDNCSLAHNRVERLYHIEKYKTKFCTKFPKSIHTCEYGEYCSFAHSLRDIKTRIIHFMLKDADFYMFYFKTEWCPFNKEHNKAQCDYAHNWQDFRRKPNIFDYNAFDLCKNWQAGTFIGKYEEGCVLQSACPRSHGWKEQEYHPFTYKTKQCEDQKCGGSGQCQYYHSETDKRLVKDFKIAMQQRVRGPMEQQVPIGQNNLVINNVNHLKEYLLNYGLPSTNFQQLSSVFKDNQIPLIILHYIEEKGVVSSERMQKLNKVNELQYAQVPQQQESLEVAKVNNKLNINKACSPVPKSDSLYLESEIEDKIIKSCADLFEDEKDELLFQKASKKSSEESSSSESAESNLEKPVERKKTHQPLSWKDKLGQLEQSYLKAPNEETQSLHLMRNSKGEEYYNDVAQKQENSTQYTQNDGYPFPTTELHRAITDTFLFQTPSQQIKMKQQKSQKMQFHNLLDERDLRDITIGEVDSSSEEGDQTPPSKQQEKHDFDMDALQKTFSSSISINSQEFIPSSHPKNQRSGPQYSQTYSQNQGISYNQYVYPPQQQMSPLPPQSYQSQPLPFGSNMGFQLPNYGMADRQSYYQPQYQQSQQLPFHNQIDGNGGQQWYLKK